MLRSTLRAALPLLTALAPALHAQTTRSATRARPAADSARIRADITYLASDALEGRLVGTPGNDSAAAYIARRFRALGLEPIVVDSADTRCAATHSAALDAARATSALGGPREDDAAPMPPRCAGYLQRFVARVMMFAHAGKPFELPTQNVAALLPGRDPALRGQVVVLGAHYDHLGRETMSASDPKAGAVIRNGADDNASGTAAILELARLLKANPPKRSVLIVAFTAEEEGTIGSQWFIDHPPVPMDSVVAMLNFDMVGRLKDDRLLVYGVATADELPGIVDAANVAGPRLTVKALPDGNGPSDHATFYTRGLPVLHFFTDQHTDYHAATDDTERINAAGEARVVDLAAAITRTIADRAERLTFKRTAPRAMAGGGDGPSGPRPYLGSVPDMAGDGASGLRLSGVTPGSPADKAGLKAGDVVVQLDGRPVTDLETYSQALYARKAGDVVAIVVLRAAAAGNAPERLTLSVTLGRRGE